MIGWLFGGQLQQFFQLADGRLKMFTFYIDIGLCKGVDRIGGGELAHGSQQLPRLVKLLVFGERDDKAIMGGDSIPAAFFPFLPKVYNSFPGILEEVEFHPGTHELELRIVLVDSLWVGAGAISRVRYALFSQRVGEQKTRGGRAP